MRIISKITTAAIILSWTLSSLSMAQEREWQLDAQGEDAFLLFGVPSTTDMGISLWCKIGQKTISVFAPMPPNVNQTGATVALKVGNVEFPLQPKFNNEQGNPTVEAEMKPRDEILSALIAADSVGLHIADHKTTFPTEGANFVEFNKLCTTAPISN